MSQERSGRKFHGPALLSEKPNAWIKPECTPNGFTWADPSKIRIGDIFLLLEHWRERQRQRLSPLIWLTSCPVLRDVSLSSDERQDYNSNCSRDDLSTIDVRSQGQSNASDPHPNSATSTSDRGPPADLSRSESIVRSNPHGSDNSDAISERLSDSNAGDVWGGLDGDFDMSSPPPLQTLSSRKAPGTSEWPLYFRTT